MPGPTSPEPLTAHAAAAPAGVVVASCAGLLAAWTAAGSLGLMAPSLESALTWLALAVALVAVWPFRRVRRDPADWALVAALLAAAVAPALLPKQGPLLATVVVLAALASSQAGLAGRALRVTALALAAFALYRFAYNAVPVVWIAADNLAGALARIAQAMTGRPLSLGATFAGIDFLVLMFGLWAAWLAATPGPKIVRAALVAAGILAGHLVFLILLSVAPQIAAALPTAPPLPPADREQTPIWFWGDALRSLIPWLLPSLAGLLNALLAAWVFRWTDWGNEHSAPKQDAPWMRCGAPLALAALVPLLAVLAPFRSDLAGRTIVVHDRGLLDWDRPEHGRYGDESAGMLGLLPDLVASLHGRLLRSPDLAPRDLEQADVLLLVHPRGPWSDEQIERLWAYVRGGGRLVLVAENRVDDEAATSVYDRLLAPTAIRIRYDCAFKVTRNWEGTLETTGLAAACNSLDPFRIEAGSSLAIGLGAAPLVVGRFGWSEPGSDALATGYASYDSGERLGDLVLAAQQAVGRGRVLVLGDTTPITNLGLPSSYPFVGRLLAWMAARAPDPQSWPRQALALLAMAGLVAVILRAATPERLALSAIALGVSLAACQAINARVSVVLPDGRSAGGAPAPVRVAYIGGAHLEDHAGCRWSDSGVNGLALTLMRNGYLPLLLPSLDGAHLDRAEILLSIAPGRPFSAEQRQLVRRFVERGGVWICMVGAEQAEAVNPLLAEFGLHVPRCPIGADRRGEEPEPLGCFYAKYLENDQGHAAVLLHDAWPVECREPDGQVVLQSEERRPVAVVRPVLRGSVALIGDSRFAWNKNLEEAEGESSYAGHGNADFWRWFIARLTGRSPWIPPLTKSEEPAEAKAAGKSKPSPPAQKSEVRP